MIPLPTIASQGPARFLYLLLSTCLLSACISVFPQSDPAQLYRFQATVPDHRGTVSAEPTFNVLLGRTVFDRAAAGDRILTVSGTQAAYIKGVRWVTSAEDLFNVSLQQAFDADRGPARLVHPGDLSPVDFVLKLQVHTFAAQYATGQDTAPEIIVALQATLSGAKDRTVIADRQFSAAVTAEENRVESIVQAFDGAVSQVLGELVNWVGSQPPVPHAKNTE